MPIKIIDNSRVHVIEHIVRNECDFWSEPFHSEYLYCLSQIIKNTRKAGHPPVIKCLRTLDHYSQTLNDLMYGYWKTHNSRRNNQNDCLFVYSRENAWDILGNLNYGHFQLPEWLEKEIISTVKDELPNEYER